MSIEDFIDAKSAQLAAFVRGVWDKQVPFSEVSLFFWDVLEEWAQIEYPLDYPYTQKERVFWHLLHQINYWSEDKFLHDEYLRSELLTCVECIEGVGKCPIDCIGIRP